MKILLFAATKKGLSTLEALIYNYRNELSGVFISEERNVHEKYTDRIKNKCDTNNIACFEWKSHHSSIENIISELSITHIFLIGWPYLLPDRINDKLHSKMIVFHDSLLPKYRGFSPLPTAMICGEKEVGFSVLFAEKEVDSGNIIFQKKYNVGDDAQIGDVIELFAKGYAEIIPDLIKLLDKGKIPANPQNHSQATYSIWRDIEDMHINWNTSSNDIHNFIKALGQPYLGAFSFLNGKKIYILSSELVSDIQFAIRQPGKIWRINGNSAIVVCKSGMLKITNCIYEGGEEVEFNSLRSRLI